MIQLFVRCAGCYKYEVAGHTHEVVPTENLKLYGGNACNFSYPHLWKEIDNRIFCHSCASAVLAAIVTTIDKLRK